LYLSSFLFFIFLEWLNSLKLKQTLTGSYFYTSFKISSLILLTVSLPPKRDAKVGKNTITPNNYTN